MKLTMDIDIVDGTITTSMDDGDFSGNHFLLLLGKIMQDTLLILQDYNKSFDETFEEAQTLVIGELERAKRKIEASDKLKKLPNHYEMN